MMIAEIRKEHGWELAEPMQENRYHVSPKEIPDYLSTTDSENLPDNFKLTNSNAKYEPVNIFPDRNSELFYHLMDVGNPGCPEDSSRELKEYYEKYWKNASRGIYWIEYSDLKKQRSLVSIVQGYLQKYSSRSRLRIVFWFY
jgi:hypothetical protein